jgi:hypothetical protein
VTDGPTFRVNRELDGTTQPATRIDRRFYMGAAGEQLVVELDGTTHTADPADPELIELAARIRGYLEADAAESFEGRVAAALQAYLDQNAYIDIGPLGSGQRRPDGRPAADVEDLAAWLAAIDELLQA